MDNHLHFYPDAILGAAVAIFTIFVGLDTVGLMASVYKDPRGRSPFWYVAYRTVDGRLVRRSTKHTERKKAWEVARNVEQAEVEAAKGRLHPGRVRELISEVLERTMDRPLREATVRSWFTDWLTGKKAEGYPLRKQPNCLSSERPVVPPAPGKIGG